MKDQSHKSNLMSKSELIFNETLRRYLQIVKQNCQKNSIEYRAIDRCAGDRPTYKVEDNNNSNLIEAALKKRWWWK